MRGQYSSLSGVPAVAEDPINLISQDMKVLVKKIQDLRHLGIEDSNIALPKICVVGDQSTGKSSLIEGMSEIKVPRSAGTCTRCPMEINLTNSSEPSQSWVCRVFLSRRYMFDATKKVQVKKSQPLGPWVEQEPEDEDFATLFDKGQVQDTLKWAQLAILNPGRPSTDYIPGQNVGTDDSHYQVKFSPNVVRLDISAAEFPNLSFYDLPGVISQAEVDDERYLVSLVENLVRDYICQENCIVLLALPMTDDATNSSAARIIRDVRGAKARTLGVLTKPDRVQSGEYSQWAAILEGVKFSLGHGYFVVRNNKDPSIEHAVARAEEADFFASDPWSSELCGYQDRFGTRRLQTALSNLLLEQIQGCLPRVIEQIDGKAGRIDTELRALPDPPSSNVQYILCKKLDLLKGQIRAHIDGGSSMYPLQKIWSHIAMDFKKALVTTRPKVQLLTELDSQVIPAHNNDSDSDCEMISGAPTLLSTKREASGAERDQQAPPATSTKPSGYNTNHFEAFRRPAKTFTLDEIREINQDSYSAGIPDQMDPKAIEIMNQLSVVHWHEPMNVFLEATHRLVREMLLRQLEDVFVQYYQTSLFREVKRIILAYLHGIKHEHLDHAKENYQIELNKPFTMATTELDIATRNSHAYFSKRRHDTRAKNYLKLHYNLPDDRQPQESELRKLTAAELGPDQFIQEMKMMAVCFPIPGFCINESNFLDNPRIL